MIQDKETNHQIHRIHDSLKQLRKNESILFQKTTDLNNDLQESLDSLHREYNKKLDALCKNFNSILSALKLKLLFLMSFCITLVVISIIQFFIK